MRIAFKSLVVLRESKTTFGDTTTTRTTYDMNSVHDHELDVSWSSLAFHPEALWRLAILMLMPLILVGIWTQGDPFLMFLGSLPFLLLFWSLAYAVAKDLVLTQHAKRDRDLPEEAKLGVVPEHRWAVFLSKLQVPSAFERLQMQSEQSLQAIRAVIRRLEEQKHQAHN